MKILITGGAGFIGSNLAKYLVSRGYEVKIIDNLSTGKIGNLREIAENIELKIGDITDDEAFKDFFEEIDYVVHLAAVTSVQKSLEEPDLTYNVNVEGTRNILEFSEKFKIKRFVFASSCAIYGNLESLPFSEESSLSPLSPYAESKVKGEKICFDYFEKGLDMVILRFFNVFGPKQDADSPYSGVISRFVKKILNGENPIIYGDGEQTRDFVYIEDILRAIEKALSSKLLKNRVFNIGSGQRYSVNQIFKFLKEISSFNGSPQFVDGRKGEVRHTLADISRAERELGWKPEISIYEGLRRTFEYMKCSIEKAK